MLKKYTAYYYDDFGQKYSAFLDDDPKLEMYVDCLVYKAEDVDAEIERLQNIIEDLRT